MTSTRNRRSSGSVLVLGLALVGAACISVSEDPPTGDSTAPPVESGPTAIDAGEFGNSEAGRTAPSSGPESAQPVTEFTEPVADTLPSLTEIDDEILRGELDNGLRYLIRANDNPGSKVDMRLAIDAGSALQEDDQGGGAHFLEHMLFNGTEQFPANELVAVLRSFGAAFGADVNARTNYDETVYSLTMPTGDRTVVLTGLDVLVQWLTSATIDPDAVVAERGIVLDEWRRSADSTSGRIFDEVQRLFLDGSPYEDRRAIGTQSEIMATEAGELRRFYERWYRPDNATVVVVGDIDPEEIERQIVERFGGVDAPTEPLDRPVLVVEPKTTPQVAVIDDPDLSKGFAFVTLPTAVEPSSPEETAQREILDALAFDIIGTRLSNDALRGSAPFDRAAVDSSGFVRLLDAPEISVDADGEDLEASTQAILDEYERVRRFGFTTIEVERAVAERRSAARVDYDGRFTRQDRSYADEYVEHALRGDPLPTADRAFEFVDAVLDGATPQTVGWAFTDRLERSAPHVFVASPAAEASEVPPPEAFVAQVVALPTRPLEPRPPESVVTRALMERPEPVVEIESEVLVENFGWYEPHQLTFANGVRFVYNTTPISEGVIIFEGRSPGGLGAVADDDVADAMAAVDVVDESGVADVDPVELALFLADKEVDLDADISPFEESIDGFAATTDAETLFQLLHLTMTSPRVDAVALDRYIDDELPFAEDPSISPGYAEFKALTEARYDDPRFRLPTVESLASVAATDVERVFRQRYGDPSDWAFAVHGDFDEAEIVDLARRYLGTLPATDVRETTDYTSPPPPEGIVVETVNAGDGDQAQMTVLFTAEASNRPIDDMTARVVERVLTARLTDSIREELGESYSPFARVELGGGGSPETEIVVSISTGPELLDEVSAAVHAQLQDLRDDGPKPSEFASAQATVAEELGFVTNQQLNDELLDRLVDPESTTSFAQSQEFASLVADVSATSVRDALRSWAPADEYIEVRVRPR